MTVFVPSKRYHQTNSAQALKEADRFTQPIPQIHAQRPTVSRLCTDVLGLPGEMFRDTLVDVDFRMSTIRVRVRVRGGVGLEL